MQKGDNSQNLYWLMKKEASFVPTDRIESFDIVYRPKTIEKELGILNSKPIVYTSGTLSYEGLIEEMGKEPKQLQQAQPIPTNYPFNDCLFYYDPKMPKYDNEDHEKYVRTMAERIGDLIKATNGKALVLFTSKEEMNEVYTKVSEMGLSQEIMLQDNNNTAECIERFKTNINSCLFATGAFWQGVDFEGVALSNLIITRLPFPIKDAEMKYKINMIKNDKNLSPRETKLKIADLNFNKMLLQFRQGFGRGKRKEDDHVLYSCLDPRFAIYKSIISRYLPSDLIYTTSMEDVVSYAEEYILADEKKLT